MASIYKIKTGRDNLITLLKDDSTLSAEFGIANIKKGLEGDVLSPTVTKAIRVVTEGVMDREEDIVISSGKVEIHVLYTIQAFFLESDPADAEDRHIEYDTDIRHAIGQDREAGGVFVIGRLGGSDYLDHPSNNAYVTVVEFIGRLRELAGAR